MALLGWMLVTLVALAISAMGIIILALTLKLSGRVTGESILALACAAFLWWLSIKHAPFVVTLTG